MSHIDEMLDIERKFLIPYLREFGCIIPMEEIHTLEICQNLHEETRHIVVNGMIYRRPNRIIIDVDDKYLKGTLFNQEEQEDDPE